MKTKICPVCTKEFDANREFCSLTCASQGTRRKTKQAYSIEARGFLKKNCEACGVVGKLIIHHVDQDKSNNVENNLQTLCKPCHDFWHSLAKRLGIEIAGRMPSLKAVEFKEPEFIVVWRFDKAPAELQALSRNGGDEDWLAEIPSWADEYYLGWMDSGSPFGCSSVDEFDHPSKPGWKVRIGAHS